MDQSLNIPWNEGPTIPGIPLFARKRIIPEVPGYSMSDPLGSGTFGEVWQAMHEATRQLVAVKFYTTSANEELVGELEKLREVCGHPNVVSLLDAGRISGTPYLVMRYYPDCLNRHLGPETSVRQASRWLEQLADGLVHIHATNTVHCDLKPSNLLLDEEMRLKVADFGQASGPDRLGVWGTLGFMPPEQIASRTCRVAVSWDVYAFGAVAYSLLTGRLPRLQQDSSCRLLQTAANHADQLDLYRKLLFQEELIPPRRFRPDLDEKLETIILSCLQLEPGLRPNSMSEVSEDLKRRREGFPLLHCLRPGRLGFRSHAADDQDLSQKIALATLYGEWQKVRQGRQLSTPTELSELGQRLLDQGQPLGAFDVLSRAYRGDPVDPVICRRLACSLLRCGDWWKARQTLVELRSRVGEEAQTSGLLGETYFQQWKESGEKAHLATAAQLLSDSHLSSLSQQNTSEAFKSAFRIACFQQALQEPGEAQTWARKCLQLCPQSTDSEQLMIQAFCRFLLGQKREAEAIVARVFAARGGSLAHLADLRSRARNFFQLVGQPGNAWDGVLPSPPVYQVESSALRFEELNRETLRDLKAEKFPILSTAVQSELDLQLLLSLLLHDPEIHLVQPCSTEHFLKTQVSDPSLGRDSARLLEEADHTVFSGDRFLPGPESYTLALSRGLGKLRAQTLCTSLKPLQPFSKEREAPDKEQPGVFAYLRLQLDKGQSDLIQRLAASLEKCAAPFSVKEQTRGYILIYDRVEEAAATALFLAHSLARTDSHQEVQMLLDGGPSELVNDPILRGERFRGQRVEELSYLPLPLPPSLLYCTEVAAAWLLGESGDSRFSVSYTGEMPMADGNEHTAVYRVLSLQKEKV